MTTLAKILSHLPPDKIQELESVTGRITDTGEAEIVVLFGSYARGDYREERGENRVKRSDYDILVAVTAGKKEAVEESLRGRLRAIALKTITDQQLSEI